MSFSVIISSRNADNLVACIRAIREAGETCRIILVDDGLDLVRLDDLGDYRKNVSLGPGKKPFCYARNINIGIRAAGDDDVILLNDDALLKTPEGFKTMAEACQHGGYGILGAVTNSVGNANQLRQSAPNSFAVRDEPRQLCFVCVYIPRSTINAVGLLDERFCADYGMEDDDYSLRVRNAGLKLGIYDGCFVDHLSLNSSFRGEGGRGGDFTGNMKLFIAKWGFDNWGRTREQSPYRNLFPAL